MRVMMIMVLLGSGCAMDGGPGSISTALDLERAWWSAPHVLQVSLRAWPGGTFELEQAAPPDLLGAPDCLGELCVVTFVGASEPRVLWHVIGANESAAPLLECSEDSSGLCPFGYTCRDRACTPLCGPSHPDGVCTDGAICVDGWCTASEGD